MAIMAHHLFKTCWSATRSIPLIHPSITLTLIINTSTRLLRWGGKGKQAKYKNNISLRNDNGRSTIVHGETKHVQCLFSLKGRVTFCILEPLKIKFVWKARGCDIQRKCMYIVIFLVFRQINVFSRKVGFCRALTSFDCHLWCTSRQREMTTKCEMQILLLKMAVTIREIEQSGSSRFWRVATKDSFQMALMDYSSSNIFDMVLPKW